MVMKTIQQKMLITYKITETKHKIIYLLILKLVKINIGKSKRKFTQLWWWLYWIVGWLTCFSFPNFQIQSNTVIQSKFEWCFPKVILLAPWCSCFSPVISYFLIAYFFFRILEGEYTLFCTIVAKIGNTIIHKVIIQCIIHAGQDFSINTKVK